MLLDNSSSSLKNRRPSRKRKRCEHHRLLASPPMKNGGMLTKCILSSAIILILLHVLLILDTANGFVPLEAAAFENRGFHLLVQGRNYMQISSATRSTRCIVSQRICREQYHLLLRATELLEPETAREKSVSPSSSSSSMQTSSPSLFDGTWLEEESSNIDDDSQLQLPPWLSRYDDVTAEQVTNDFFAWLEFSLRQQEWPAADIQEISQELQHLLLYDNNSNNNNNVALVAGCIDFLRTYLHAFVEHESKPLFVTKTVLLAAIQHYVDCIAVRKKGIHDLIRQTILKQEPGRMLGGMQQPVKESSSSSNGNCQKRNSSSSCSTRRHHKETSTAILLVNKQTHAASKMSSSPRNKVMLDEIHSIVIGAARIKRAEILSQVFLASANMSDTKTAQGVRSLLLAVTEDFRALAIRCVACLFRLEGILQYASSQCGDDSGEYLTRTPEIIRTAKEGISVYAPLAQRMGLPKLKARIEDAAFRVLYRRQYKAVASLYLETGHTMKTVSNYLLSDITKTLRQDKSFMSQIEDLQITSRVKEPYSFWKKLLKNRMKPASTGERGTLVPSSVDGSGSKGTLSVTNVQDVVAFRVVLRAKRFSDDEDDETTRARERILCYYVQSLLQLKWGGTRLKDYIQHPKSNGYQSLHHTSTIITSGGLEFPFEIQVRSRDMHEAAEHGQASHWFYKLSGGKASPALIEPSMPLLLPSPREFEVADSLRTVSKATLGVEAEVPYRGSTGSYLEALTTSKRLLKTNVHVFMAGSQETQREGRLVSLPSNSQVQDVVRVMKEGDVPGGDDAASIDTVWRNGRIADLNDTVVNGDVLLIASQ